MIISYYLSSYSPLQNENNYSICAKLIHKKGKTKRTIQKPDSGIAFEKSLSNATYKNNHYLSLILLVKIYHIFQSSHSITARCETICRHLIIYQKHSFFFFAGILCYLVS